MRLDIYLVNNYNYSRSRAIDLIKLGSVKVNGKVVLKPAKQILITDVVAISDKIKYASRAGLKLEEAIKYFKLNFNDKTILDVGSSTGGFTEVSLKNGAKRVYAYDVGKNQMVLKLKSDERVYLFEQTNILKANPKRVDICLIDVSFVSIRPIIKHLKGKADLFIMLFKPQFETERKIVHGGVIKSEEVLTKLKESFKEFLKEEQISLRGELKLSLKGKKGNQEYIFVGDSDARKNKN